MFTFLPVIAVFKSSLMIWKFSNGHQSIFFSIPSVNISIFGIFKAQEVPAKEESYVL